MARIYSRRSRGFTLIELLVVISIIGLLSSVILAALSSARTKGKESVIIQDLIQFRNLYESAYATTGNYSPLQPANPGTGGNCFYYSGTSGYKCTATSISSPDHCAMFYGPSSPEVANNPSALSLCYQIVNMTGNFSIGLAAANSQQYSLWAWLPSQQTFQCFGSSKNTSATSSPTSNPGGGQSPGCPANP